MKAARSRITGPQERPVETTPLHAYIAARRASG